MATGPLEKEDRVIAIRLRGPFGGYKSFLRGERTWEEISATIPHAGIYQIRRINGKRVPYKLKFYRPTNPQTVPQQARRIVFAAGVTHWQSLTTEEKNAYNKRARPLRIEGFNLHQREWMYSH